MLSERQQRAWAGLGIGPAWTRRSARSTGEPAASEREATGAGRTDMELPPLTGTKAHDPADGIRRVAPGPAHTLSRDWVSLASKVDACRACALGASRNRAVVGSGSVSARWLLIGEAPGAEEDKQGEAFVGRAGELLDGMLGAVGLDRDREVYITNVLKCRPPGNRNPTPDEVSKCEGHLLAQIGLLRPALIVLMGRFAAQTLLRTEASIAGLRGRVHDCDVGGQTIKAVVTYHPAYLLRSPADKALAWADWCLAGQTMRRLETSQ